MPDYSIDDWQDASRRAINGSRERREETARRRHRKLLRDIGVLLVVFAVLAYCLVWTYSRVTAPVV